MNCFLASVAFALLKIVASENDVNYFRVNLDRLTNQLVEEYFWKFKCLTVVSDEVQIPFRFARDKPIHLIILSQKNLLQTKNLLVKSFNQGCGGFVVQVERNKLWSIVDILVTAKRKASGFRYNNQMYLILTTQTYYDPDFSVMKHPGMFFLPNLALIAPYGNDSFSIYGPTILNHYKYDILRVTHELLDTWSPTKGFSRHANLYPDRTNNVMGRKFIFAVVNYSPFSIVINEGNTKVFDGFETRIAALFVRMINGTWEGIDHADLWGDLFANGSGTGIIGSIVGGHADIGFSALYQWWCDDVDCTYPFYQSGITCLAPRPNLISEWLTIILPYAPGTWFALILAFFCNTFFYLFLSLVLKHLRGAKIVSSLGSGLSDSFFTIFRIQLEQIPRIPKIYQPLAVFVRIIVFYYFFVAAFWQGEIASILTVPRYEKPIDNTADLVERWPQIEWGANSYAWIKSIQASTDPNFVKVVNKFLILDDETLREKAKTKRFVFFIEELPHGHYGFSDYINEESMIYLRQMKNKMYTAFGVYLLPKGSPFSEKFDRSVLRMFDTGLVHKMEDQVSVDRINNKLQKMIKTSGEKESPSVRLAIRHVRGPLYIYLIGISLATVAFMAEIFVRRFRRTLETQSLLWKVA